MTSIVGTERKGDVFIRDFDIGIFTRLQTVTIGDRIYLPMDKAPGVPTPIFDETHGIPSEVGTDMPGIPIIFANPDDSIQRYNYPCIRIGREDPSPALERWMSMHLKYRKPADGAQPVTVQYGNRTLQGYDKYEDQEGAYPFDIPYTITAESSGMKARTYAQVLLLHMMKRFNPYSVIPVIDSLGETRIYNVFVEGPSELSIVSDLRDRAISYALSLRVSAEFDLNDPIVRTVVSAVNISTARKPGAF